MKTTRLFAVSNAAKNVLVTIIGLHPGRIEIIPNGVEMSCFRTHTDSPAGNVLKIGTVGNLTAVKNQSLLLRAAALLREQGIHFHLSIAGEGPERQHLLRLAEQYGIQEQVTLMGHVSDIPSFLEFLDVFVLSSKTEAHPNALLEAMAAGSHAWPRQWAAASRCLTMDDVAFWYQMAMRGPCTRPWLKWRFHRRAGRNLVSRGTRTWRKSIPLNRWSLAIAHYTCQRPACARQQEIVNHCHRKSIRPAPLTCSRVK